MEGWCFIYCAHCGLLSSLSFFPRADFRWASVGYRLWHAIPPNTLQKWKGTHNVKTVIPKEKISTKCLSIYLIERWEELWHSILVAFLSRSWPFPTPLPFPQPSRYISRKQSVLTDHSRGRASGPIRTCWTSMSADSRIKTGWSLEINATYDSIFMISSNYLIVSILLLPPNSLASPTWWK